MRKRRDNLMQTQKDDSENRVVFVCNLQMYLQKARRNIGRRDGTPTTTRAGTRVQRRRGCLIIQVGDDFTRFRSAKQVWHVIHNRCCGKPRLIMAVLPRFMRVQLAQLAEPVPVVRAAMRYSEHFVEPIWCGYWLQTVGETEQRVDVNDWIGGR